MRTAKARKVCIVLFGALAMLGWGAGAAYAAPLEAPPAIVDPTPNQSAPELTSVSPASVTRTVEETFTLRGKNLGKISKVIGADTYQNFEAVSDSEIRFTGRFYEQDEVTLYVTGPTGTSNSLSIKMLPIVWKVPADDLTITYGQAAELSGDFSALTEKHDLFISVGDDDTYDPTRVEGNRVFATLDPRSYDAGKYPLQVGFFPYGMSAADGDMSQDRESGTLEVLRSPTQIDHKLTGQTLAGTVRAKYDSIPTGTISVSIAPGSAVVTAELNDRGEFRIDNFTDATSGFEIAYAGNKTTNLLRHHPAQLTL